MKMARMFLVTFVVLAAAFGFVWKRSFNDSGATSEVLLNDGPNHPYLSDWSLLGPFRWDTREMAAGAEPLTPILAKEMFDLESTSSVQNRSLKQIKGIPWRSVHVGNGNVKLEKIFPATDYECAFAITNVYSSSEMDAAALIESDDGVRVWVNGKQVFTSGSLRRVRLFGDYVRIHLEKGVNRILLKLVHAKTIDPANPWSFAVGIRTLRGAREERWVRNPIVQELLNPIVGDDQLQIDLSLYDLAQNVGVEIRDGSHRAMKTVVLKGGQKNVINVGELPAGLYSLYVPTSASREEFPFYKGDAEAAYRALLVKSKPLLSAGKHKANLGALDERVRHLYQPEYINQHDIFWQTKIVGAFVAWNRILANIAMGEDPYKDQVGTHLRGYISQVDGQIQYYLLHIPKSYTRNKGPIPLLIMVPNRVTNLRPFLESVGIADITDIKIMDEAADQNGFAYLWQDRGNTTGADLEDADLFAAVEQVKQDYEIDANRIYLFGSCSGGREALGLAAKYPDRFAAVGTMSPAALFQPQAPSRITDTYACRQVTQRSPIDWMGNLVDTPSYAIHGDEDTHMPLLQSKMIEKAATSAGASFRLDVIQGADHWRFPVDPRSVVFPWFLGKKRERNPDRVKINTTQLTYGKAFWVEITRFGRLPQAANLDAFYHDGIVDVHAENVASYRLSSRALLEKTDKVLVRTDGAISFQGSLGDQRDIDVSVQPSTPSPFGIGKTQAISGPVSNLFAAPFLVVVGTGGTARQRHQQSIQAEQFVASWRAQYFVAPRVKLDREITQQDINLYHLILFGDSSSNRIISRLAGKLPFQYGQGNLHGPSHTYQGSTLSAQYIFPNPLNRDRYILLAGNPDCASCPIDAVQLSLKGWYDYVIWRWNQDGEVAVEDIGTFDSSWSSLVSEMQCNLKSQKATAPIPDGK